MGGKGEFWCGKVGSDQKGWFWWSEWLLPIAFLEVSTANRSRHRTPWLDSLDQVGSAVHGRIAPVPTKIAGHFQVLSSESQHVAMNQQLISMP